jgi:CRISPR-associated protein Cmr5
MATRQQRWSKAALQCVAEVRQGQGRKEVIDVKRYRTLCMKGASLLRQSGVVQALVFLKAREGPEGEKFAGDLAKVYDKGDLKALLQAAQTAHLTEYMAMTNDLVNVAIWFRRFAQSELEGKA